MKGKIVVPRARFAQREVVDLRLEFECGEVVRWSAAKGAICSARR